MTDPKNTLPPNSSQSSETPQAPSSESKHAVVHNQEPPATGKDSTTRKIELSSPEDKQTTPSESEPSADKKSSVEEKQAAGADAAITEKAAQIPPNKIKQPVTNAPPQQRSGQARLALFFSILTLILLAVSTLYFWQNQTQQTTQIEQLLQLSQNNRQHVETSQLTTQQKLGKLDDRLFQQQAEIAQLNRQTAFNSQKLTDLGARSRMDWLLAEAEYLMRLANQRLNLEHDIKSAEAMLSSADSILAEINDPGLNGIRKTLAMEVLSLQQLRHLDRQGLYFKLDALIQNIEAMKQQAFLNEEPTLTNATVATLDTSSEAATENTFLQAWHTIWRDLKQAVTIRRLDQPLPPLLAPEQHYYLKQNLRLMLEQASLALLNENPAVYQASLKKADTWLKQYFLQNDPLIQQIQNTIKEMAGYEITLELPDISHSLRLTKAKIESFYRQHSLNKLSSPHSESITENAQNTDTQQASSEQGAAL